MQDPIDILNWRRIDHTTSLSGQPTQAQLAIIRTLGVNHIINLGPHTNTGALDDDAGDVAALGMTYDYIPVDFEHPTEADFQAFCDTVERLEGRPKHVHCIYNARVSAFYYRYAKIGKGQPVQQAFDLMDGIWRPGGVWAAFIGDTAAVGLANRYAGYDY